MKPGDAFVPKPGKNALDDGFPVFRELSDDGAALIGISYWLYHPKVAIVTYMFNVNGRNKQRLVGVLSRKGVGLVWEDVLQRYLEVLPW